MVITVETGTPTKGVRARNWAFWVAYLLASALIIVSYSSIFRPMWIDEAIHFVLSGHPTLGELLLRLHNPDAGFLTRQTGFYQVINYLTLQVTGANWVALRLPSILSAALMIWAMYVFLRERGVSRTFQFVGLIALAGQAGFMYYVGEARPYLPYAATTLGVLAYFTASAESQRKSHVKWLGWLSLYLGALFHLYFLLVIPAVLAYSVWYWFFRLDERPSWRSLRQAGHPWLVASSLVLALILGWLTWMRPQETNQLEAFAWTGGSLTSLADTALNFHLEFLPAPALRTSFLIVEAGLVLYLLVSRKFRTHRELFASGVLIVLAITTSVIISVASVANNYAIATRQLVVGPLLIAVAFTWQLFVTTRAAKRIQLSRNSLLVGAGVGLIYGLFLIELNIRIPMVPLSLLIVTNVLLATILTQQTLDKWIPYRHVLLVTLVTALGLVATALSVTTRIAPRWQALGSFMLGLMLLLAAMLWQAKGRKLTLATVVTAAIISAFGISALSVAGSRFIVVRSEYTAKANLEEEVRSLGSLELSRLEGLDANAIRELQMNSGQAWVYLSNVNALRGGPVWQGLGSL